jgi:biopolymer transport protein ExbB
MKDGFRSGWVRAVSSLILAVMLVGMWTAPILAQDGKKEDAPADKPASARKDQSAFGWFYEAEGVFFWPQLAISIATIAFIGQNLLHCMPKNFSNEVFRTQFEQMVKERKFKEAYDLAKGEKSLLGKMLVAGLSKVNEGHGEAMTAIQELGDDENMKYEHRLSYLAMIGNIATLVGLLGTVYGMVGSFITIGQSDTAPKPSELAKGVSQALVTTIVGLVQAIPAIIGFTILKNLVSRRFFDVGSTVETMMKPFKAAVGARRAPDAGSTMVGQGSTAATPAAPAG